MKQETVIDRAPMVRCYKCGSPVVFSLCHHCARPMCEKHSPFAFRQAGTPVREAGDDARDAVKPASLEFAWLKQSDPRRAAVYHCAEHAHTVRHGLAGLVFAALAFLQRGGQSASDPASLPLFPHVNTVEVIERLNGKISFAEGKYTSTADRSVAGEITIDMSANDGEDWLRRYRKKYRLPENEPVRFAAGYAMVKGKAGLRFAAGQDMVLANGMGLSLSGDSVVSRQLFEHVPGHPPGEWNLSARYEVRADSPQDEIPLWIVPSVVPSSDRRTLEIDLHWNQLGPEGRKLNFTRFESIELEVPAGWGAVEGSDPSGPTIESGHRGHRIIRWEQIGRAADRGGQSPTAMPYGGKSRPLTLQFERPVLPAPAEDDEREPEANGNGTPKPATTEDPRLRGTLKATFEPKHPDAGTLSGVEGIDIYLPGGGQTRQKPEVRVRTEITVEFDISLGAIRYQDDWVVPDDSNAKAQRDNSGQTPGRDLRRKDDEFTGVVPDSQTVTELTNIISREGYYVKSAVEHPPYRDDRRGNVVSHVWDIAGRWYHGVFPVDFDINLRGEEVAEDGYAGLSGKTIAQVTVKGTYVNDEALTQRKLIEAKWDNLYGHVTELLRSRAAGGSGAPAISSPGAASEWDDVVQGVTVQDGVQEDHRMHDAVVMDAEIVEPEPLVTPPDDRSSAERKADLLRQWSAADDAVMAGRISEETHRGIIARINTELRELGEQP
jgi:hypothetical protein